MHGRVLGGAVLAMLAGCCQTPPAAPARPVEPARLDVTHTPFGADPTGRVSASAAIQTAIDLAATRTPPPPVVLPAGRYLLTTPLLIARDAIALLGEGDPVLISQTGSFAILVHRGDLRAAPDPVDHLVLAGFSIEVHGGRRNTGVITLNNATHVVVRDVHLSASADSDRATWYDGISTSRGTSGLLERVTVDGMVKVGIYIARGSHDVVVRDCEASHSGIGAGHPFPGMSTSGASGVTFERCHSRDNTGEGLLIAADGAVGDLPPLASSDVTVRGGSFDHNGHEAAVRTDSLGGIAIGSGWQNPEAIPRRIRLEGVRSVRNSSHGIRIESGEDIGVIDADVGENGAQGISIDGWSPAYPFVIRVSNVEIARTAIYNNGLCWATREVAAVGVRLARGIRVHDATITDRLTGREAACLSGEPAGTRQGRAIDLVAEPPDVVVRDVTIVGSSPGKLETDARGGLRVAP